jgi:alpha-methylacyl-CoA racemase
MQIIRDRFDGGIHYYETYETKDGKHMTVGALEPQFYQELIQRLSDAGVENVPDQYPDDSEEAKAKMTDIFLQKTQEEWRAIFDGTDACVAPVLSLDEAPLHEHNLSRGSFVRNTKGQYDPAPAPRLSRTPAQAQNNVEEPSIGENTREILMQMGYTTEDIQKFVKNKVAHQINGSAKL